MDMYSVTEKQLWKGLSHIMKNMFILYVNNKHADQSVHPYSGLISVFAIHNLDSIMLIDALSRISKFLLAS